MGGWGSGRYGGRPIVEHSFRIDLAWMLRRGLAKDGEVRSGILRWTRGGEPSGSISYRACMDVPGEERLELIFTRGSGDDREEVRQTVYLRHTRPNYGGKRWWMICPYRALRVGKLYLPPGGDRFASRKAWELGYHSQRISSRDRPFEALERIQKKLGCPRGWQEPIRRPKGMWHSTYTRLEEQYWDLDAQCTVEMMASLSRLSGLSFGKI